MCSRRRSLGVYADPNPVLGYAVRSAFADVVREQSERELSRDTRSRYDET